MMEITNPAIAGGQAAPFRLKTEGGPVLMPFQREAVEWLKPKRLALLALEMGLGKSAVVVAAVSSFGPKTPVLVLCPAIARENWKREFEKFSPRKWATGIVDTQDWWKKQNGRLPELTICSYELAPQLANLGVKWSFLVLDEAHYLKSLDARRTQIVFGRDGLCRKAKNIWALTGTPAPNHYGELWVLLYSFGATKLSYENFVKRYCRYLYGTYGLHIVGSTDLPDRIAELRKMLEPIMLRRLTKDVLKELAPMEFDDIVVPAGDIHVDWLTDVEMQKVVQELDFLQTALEASDRLGQPMVGILEALAQSVSTLRRYNGLQKVEPVAELVTRELESHEYEKIVLFCHHRVVVEELAKRLLPFGALTIHGGTPDKLRQEAIRRFQSERECRVLVANIGAAGTAITLTAANQVLFVEQDWVPGNNAQAAKRCHRIGQNLPVFVRCVGIAGSIDERVSGTLKRKTKEILKLIDKRTDADETSTVFKSY